MNKEEFRQMCDAQNFTTVAIGKAVGIEGEYVVTLKYTDRYYVTIGLPASKGDQKIYGKALKAALKERLGRRAAPMWGRDCMAVRINIKNMEDVYQQGIAAVVDAVKSVGFCVSDTCAVCGQSGCDSAAALTGAAYAPVHRSCLDRNLQDAQDKAETNALQGSYLLGIIGAFLGMIVGIVPSVFTILAVGRIFVVLFMLIPLCSYFGYCAFKGKKNRMALIVSVVFSVMGIFLMSFFEEYYYLASYFEMSFSEAVSLLPAAAGEPEIWADIVGSPNFKLYLLFTALGILCTWTRISRTSKSDVMEADNARQTAISYEELRGRLE